MLAILEALVTATLFILSLSFILVLTASCFVLVKHVVKTLFNMNSEEHDHD